ncbi:MAG: site-specific integrase [Streptosporangiaceae bacterium]
MAVKPRSRGRRGAGTIFHDKDRGCYVGQASYIDDAGKRRRPKVFGQTADECQDKLDAQRGELKTTGTVAPKDLSVKHIMEDLLAHPPSSWKSPLTIRGNRDRTAHVIAGLGKVKLARLTVAHVERFLDGLAAEGMSSDTIIRCRALLRLAIRRAERDGKIGRNVAALADPPSGTRRKSRAMNLPQINALLALKLNPFWRAYIVTGLMCGLRPGELLGLRWEDVDFDGGVVRVRKCLKALPDPKTGKRQLVLADLKTEQSRRTIQMPRLTAVALRELRTDQARWKLKLGAAYDLRGMGLVFTDRAGAPRWPQDINRYFKVLCERAGIGGKWTPRELRHTFVSVLSDSGVDIEKIAEAVGHVNSTITKVVYRHQIADKVTVAATAMDAIFGGASGS